ncbi:MAG: hypothetical protein GY810_00725 [Aureispira sp.]|nr:hypothetical protein [Aureispira sp.]
MEKLNKYTINVLFFALQVAGMYLSLKLLFWALDVPDGVDVWEAIAAAFAIFACHKFMGLKLNNK